MIITDLYDLRNNKEQLKEEIFRNILSLAESKYEELDKIKFNIKVKLERIEVYH